ncbi:MAG: septal ring lytic transglycosylase RlpA family protein [Candidatus Puniceispirillales bacterium WSBS_2018_MAG_OTU23]
MRFSSIVIVFTFLLSGCSTFEVAIDLAKKSARSGNVVAEPRYKVGNPYEVLDVWYYPERDLNYDETGIASWYGDQFAGKLTANGEIFDPELVSAAHKTLPMPSAVRVINLENGKSLVVRVNDRGPFVSGRIIDLSRAAAHLLGFKKQGIARVRVQILAEESLRLEREAKEGRFPSLGENTRAVPENSAAAVPTVSLTSNGGTTKKEASSVSAIGLISSNRVTEVIELTPIDTNIFIQVGAFRELSNAEVLMAKVDDIANANISSFDNDGQLIHRVRIGPIDDVQGADKMLRDVIDNGFNSAKIVLE